MEATEGLIQQGLQLTLFGMGTVFVFLVLLIYATRAMSFLALRLAPPVPVSPTELFNGGSVPATSDQDARLTVVIAAAIHQFRRNQKP